VDIARNRGHKHLLKELEPLLRRDVPLDVLGRIQLHFHATIRGRAEREIAEFGLRLPELELLLEFAAQNVWFAVPGMAGGFSFELHADGVDALLVSESWCRIVGGSGQRHEITKEGSRLVAEGFV
jgi:hypothetical protein